MKIKTLLPVALMMMLVSPAFAEDPATASNSAQSELQITVPEFINITKETSVEASTATFDPTYSTITLVPALNANFKVITNKPNDSIKLTATALEGSVQVNAIYGTAADDVKLVFTNINRAPSAGAIDNIKGSTPAVASNANAIAFKLTPTITPDTNSGATDPAATYDNGTGTISYVLQNGIYGFSYAVGTTAEANTFSTHDTNGTYKATLTLSQVTP